MNHDAGKCRRRARFARRGVAGKPSGIGFCLVWQVPIGKEGTEIANTGDFYGVVYIADDRHAVVGNGLGRE